MIHTVGVRLGVAHWARALVADSQVLACVNTARVVGAAVCVVDARAVAHKGEASRARARDLAWSSKGAVIGVVVAAACSLGAQVNGLADRPVAQSNNN